MKFGMNQSARRVMELAEEEARGLGHGYVGTEHVLLGLMGAGGEAAAVLRARGADARKVREAIEALVHRGTEGKGKLPWTPRVGRVVELAGEEAQFVSLGLVGEEHLALGLMREQEGVAGRVLAGLGVEAQAVRWELLRVRLEQLKVVERAVRPVRASVTRKRKMREELLAHLTTIYEQELARVGNVDEATREAAGRFGRPEELARELERVVPRRERFAYAVERWIGWRAPEPAWKYMARQARVTVMVLGVLCGLIAGGAAMAAGGWEHGFWPALRPVLAMLLVMPLAQFVTGLLYFKMRDALWGAFGARRSGARVAGWAVAFALAFVGCGWTFFALSAWEVRMGPQLLYPLWGAAVIGTAVCALQAHLHGATEIQDALWACLEIGEGTMEAA